MTEIDEVRRRLETDLRELEARIPAPLRSAKSLAALAGGTALGALVLRGVLSKRSDRHRAAEVVVRVVREDAERRRAPSRRPR